MSIKDEYDSVNQVLFKKINLLRNDIAQLKNRSKILSNNYNPDDLEVKIEDDDDLKTSFTSSMLQLDDKLENLKCLCRYEETEDCSIKNDNYSLVYIQFLNNLLTKLIEYITTINDTYKIDEDDDNVGHLRKIISKLRKKIKKIDLNFDASLFPISDIESEYSLTSSLRKQIYKLKKKLSKLISAHRKKYPSIEAESTQETKKVKRKRENSVQENVAPVENGTVVKNPLSPKKKKERNVLSQDLFEASQMENGREPLDSFEQTLLETPSKKKKDKRRNSLSDSFEVSLREVASVENGTSVKNEPKSPKKKKHKTLSQVEEEVPSLLNDTKTEEPKSKKKRKKSLNEDDEDTSILENGNSQRESPKKKKKLLSQSEDDISAYLEVNLNTSGEQTPQNSPKKNNKSASSSPDKGVRNLLNDLVNDMKNKMNGDESAQIKSPKKKEMINDFFETTIFDNDDEKEERIMAELVIDQNNILDKSVFHLAEMLEEAHNNTMISEEDKEKLKNLYIEVPTEIPPTHLIETRLTIGPTKVQQDLLKGYKIKLGQFSLEEDAILRRNWENFCLEYEFNDPSPFLTWKHDKDTILAHNERVKFVQYLGQQLGHRMLSSIYRRFKLVYRDVRKGRFTKEEDKIIVEHVKGVKTRVNRFAPLVPVLNRSRVAIQYRYYRLMSDQLNCKVKWDMEKDNELVRHLMEELEMKNLEQMRYMQISKNVWKNISEKMGIPSFKIKIHWNFKLYTQIFAMDRICWDEVKIKLFEIISEMKLDDWKTVDWRGIAINFNGFTPQFLWFLLKNTIRHSVPQQYRSSLRKSIKFIEKHIVPELKLKVSRFDQDRRRETLKKKQLHRYKLDQDGHLQSYYY